MLKQPNTLQDLLVNSVNAFAGRSSLSFVDGESMSYEQFGVKVKEVQGLLESLSVKYGDKVAIYSQNMPNWGIVYFAVTSMGAVAVPILPDFSSVEVENVLKHSESKVVFVSSRLFPKLEAIADLNVENKVILESFQTLDVAELVKRESPSLEYRVKPDDLAVIIYTSGTTGKNKGVMLSHHNLCQQLRMVYNLQKVEKDDVFLSLLPLSHTYENTLGLLLPIMCGAAVYYLDKVPTPAVLLPAVAKIRPTHMLTVPIIIQKIFRNKILPQLTATPLMRLLYSLAPMRKLMHRKAAQKLYATFGGNLKFFGIGGAKLDAVVERFLIEGKAFPYAIGYGLTETAPLLAGANPSMVKLQSTGPALDGVSMRLNEPDKTTGIGEIWVKGANVMRGYYKDTAMTAEVFSNDGWFKTGDLGAFDKQGNLFIKGRLKNVILGASGENIYPEEIESVINNFRFVTDSLVVEKKGRLVAMVRFNHEELEAKLEELRIEVGYYLEELKVELQNYVNSQVNRFSQIAVVEALTIDFEKTSTQKIKRYLYV
ncbi:MAG: AMP-binding protein [Bacteroidales bacterium]